MTEIEFFTRGKETLVGFHVYGHSGFAEEGEDIVVKSFGYEDFVCRLS